MERNTSANNRSNTNFNPVLKSGQGQNQSQGRKGASGFFDSERLTSIASQAMGVEKKVMGFIQKKPVMLLLGAVAVGYIVNRIISSRQEAEE